MSDYGTLLLNNPQCSNCGARFRLHEAETLRCPKNGQEAGPAVHQEWQDTKYSELIVKITNVPAPAEAREDEALDQVLETAYDFKINDSTTNTRLSFDAWKAQVLVAIRSRRSPQAKVYRQECPTCFGVGIIHEGMSDEKKCSDCSGTGTEPAAPQLSPQGEDADLLRAVKCTGQTCPTSCTICRKKALIAYDALRARLASAEQARDDWKCRYESLDAQGYGIARERDALKERLASAQSSAQGEEAREGWISAEEQVPPSGMSLEVLADYYKPVTKIAGKNIAPIIGVKKWRPDEARAALERKEERT